MVTPDDLVHCPICLDLYVKPRALPCLHTFCDICLQEYINTAAGSASIASGFECPLCRKHTLPSNHSGHRHTEWSKLFPINHLIVTLLDSQTDASSAKLNSQTKHSSDSTNTGPDAYTESLPQAHSDEGAGNISESSAVKDSSFDPNIDYSTKERSTESGISGKTVESCGDSDHEDSQHYQDYFPPYGPPHHHHPHHGLFPHHFPPWHFPPPHHFPPDSPPSDQKVFDQGPNLHRPPHLFGPPSFRGPPPHHVPPPRHGPPPPFHHRSHHRGSGCDGPRGELPRRGPPGRFPPPHGPRHRHRPPPF